MVGVRCSQASSFYGPSFVLKRPVASSVPGTDALGYWRPPLRGSKHSSFRDLNLLGTLLGSPERMNMPSYHPKVVEPRWQQYWEQHQTSSARPTTSAQAEIPFTSSTCSPIRPAPACTSAIPKATPPPTSWPATKPHARLQRACTRWAGTRSALPAEQYAIQTGTHPRLTTQNNINNFRRQIKMLGFSYDWEREVDTTDPQYFKWTQWIFLVLFDTWYDEPRSRQGPPRSASWRSRAEVQGKETLPSAVYRDGKRLKRIMPEGTRSTGVLPLADRPRQ